MVSDHPLITKEVRSSLISTVLTSDYAALLVQEFGRNPIINDEAAFDIYPP